MQFISGFSDLKSPISSSVVSIGNFDGVHLGHQSLVSQVIEKSIEYQCASVIVAFDPLPAQVLRPEFQVERLFSVQDLKQNLSVRQKIDHLVVEPFTFDFSQLSAEEFLTNWVLKKLNPKVIIVGHDFVFGHNRTGTFEFLQEWGKKVGCETYKISPTLLDGEVVSSSKIRQLIKQGSIERANKFLNRPYYLEGRVVQGEGRGEKLGFATANLDSRSRIIPAEGVYITEFVLGDRILPSITNIGHKPTFHSEYGLTVETFVLNSKENYYDDEVKVTLLSRLRSEIKFPSVADLLTQIRKDVDQAKKYFGM